MLDIGDEDNIKVEEVFFCYYNTKAGTLSTKRQDAFTGLNAFDVLLNDYRLVGNPEITWKTIAED